MVSCLFCRKKIWHERALSSAPKDKVRRNTYYCSKCEIYIVVTRYDSANKNVKGIVTTDVYKKPSDVTRNR